MSATTRRLDAGQLLRGSPIVLPQLLALVALLTLSAAEGGYPLEHWGPAAVITHLLLAVALLTLPARAPARLSRPAVAISVAYATWTILSLLWADDRGVAAIASTRTALMVSAFVLFARWRQSPSSAHAVLTVAVAGLGLITWGTVAGLLAADNIDPWFLFDRLLEPVGYVNASAAFFGVAAFLAAGLIGGRTALAPRLIGALVAPPAAALSLLALSRGGLLAAAIVIALLLALLPGRARNGAALLIPALAVLIAAPQLIDVGDVLRTFGTPTPSAEDPAAVLHGALARVIAGTLLAVAVTWAWAQADRTIAVDDPRRARAAKAGAAAIGAVAVLGVAAVLIGVGPITTTKISDSIDSITEPYQATAAGESRLSAGLSSGRWDFWTVAWDQFSTRPLIGHGADNYRQAYKLKGNGLENPSYPHSLWLRALGQLGIVGFALLLAWLALIAAAIRRLSSDPDPAARAIAVAAAGGLGLWVVHGSADWLQEYGGFTAIVMAVSGLVVAAGSPVTSKQQPSAPQPRAPRALLARWSALGALLLLSLWTTTQWIAERDRAAAAALAVDQPGRAVERAERADALEPFGEQADQLLGQLAISRGDYPAARESYLRAYERSPGATQPRLWLGVLASAQRNPQEARRWLRRAIRTAPRDPLSVELLARVKTGEQLDPRAVQRTLAERRRALITDPDHPS